MQKKLRRLRTAKTYVKRKIVKSYDKMTNFGHYNWLRKTPV